MWLVDNSLIPLTYLTDIRPVIIHSTDHMAISIKIRIPEPRGPGYRKLNNAYLQDKNYRTIILDIINKCYHIKVNNTLKWDIWKYEIKEASIRYATFKSRKRHNRPYQLQRELLNLYKQHTAII